MICGIGVDLVEVARIERALRRHAPRFLTKVLTPSEQADCESRTHHAEAVAARFAAKEAAMKALGTGWTRGVGFRTIEVVRDDLGAPGLRFHRGAARRADALGVARAHLSLSHTGGLAIAQVVLESGR